MWGWITALVVALLGAGISWYYRSRATDNKVADLVAENTAVLTSVNSLLAALAARADLVSKQDQKEASNVKTAKEASDFLNSSGGRVSDPVTSARAAAKVRAASRPSPSRVIHGFGRGQGNHDAGPSLRPGSVATGRAEMARVGNGLLTARS